MSGFRSHPKRALASFVGQRCPDQLSALRHPTSLASSSLQLGRVRRHAATSSTGAQDLDKILKSLRVQRRAATSCTGAQDSGQSMKSLDFSNARVAFDSKSAFELFRTWLVFRICALNFVVKNCDYLYNLSCKLLGPTITHGATRITVFNHFCAGETSTDILPKMKMLRAHGIGGILDYAAEAKDDDTPKAPQMEDHEISSVDDAVGAPLSSKIYAYEGEAECDGNAKIFLEAVRAVKDATPDGFAAIKLSGLGNPALLQRMSSLMFELVVLFKSMSIDTDVKLRPGQSLGDVLRATPMHCIDRSFKLDFDSFSKGWRRQFNVKEEDDELRRMFTEMDTDGDGLIDWLDWSSKTRLSEINQLVRDCTQEGPLFKAALNDEEVKLYFNLVNRVKSIMDLAQELGVRVMVDAEWMDIQPAIDHMVLFLQRMYNHGDEPIVFNTYQTYLKGMSHRVGRDLERSRREGWRFGAKVVRGAYMVSERKKATDRGYESPICENYHETEEEFHAALDAIFAHTAVETPPPLQPGYQDGPGRTAGAEVLVASHNRGSIERVLRKMVEYNSNKDHVHFGQLMGMADHLTFTLGANGYKAYKYVPYGPIGEVVPYLIRRTQENSTILGSDGVMEERAMVTSELRRRLNPFA